MSYLPEWLSRAITPESEGEAIVNQIYGPGGTAQTGQPDPEYVPEELGTPRIVITAKREARNLGSALLGNFKQYLIYGAVFLAILVFIYGFSRRF